MVSGPGVVGLSADSFLAWDEETAYGTKITASASSKFSQFLDDDIKGRLAYEEVPNITAATVDPDNVYLARKSMEGTVVIPVSYEGLEHLLLHAFGTLTSSVSATSATFTKTFDLSTSGRYKNSNSPSLSLHVARGKVGAGATNPTVFTYEGVVIDEFEFRMRPFGILELSLGIFGQAESLAAIALTPVYDIAPVPIFKELTCQWGAVTIPVTGFSLRCRRGIDRERYFAGSDETYEPPMAQYQTSWEIETEWDNEVRAGSTTMQADFTAKTARALDFNFTSTAKIASTTAQFYTFNLGMAKAIITDFHPTVKRRGRVVMPVSGRAYTDGTAVPRNLRLVTTGDSTYAE